MDITVMLEFISDARRCTSDMTRAGKSIEL